MVAFDRCDECGFDGEHVSDAAALNELALLPERWRAAVAGLSSEEAMHRPIPEMWSIAEYSDHVRETIFGMRFILDLAVEAPDTDLGEPPDAVFSEEPRAIDLAKAVEKFVSEVEQLVTRLIELSPKEWSSGVRLDGLRRNAHWVVRHALHDVSHHLGDVARLRAVPPAGPAR